MILGATPVRAHESRNALVQGTVDMAINPIIKIIGFAADCFKLANLFETFFLLRA
jgi:hypothetical protein